MQSSSLKGIREEGTLASRAKLERLKQKTKLKLSCNSRFQRAFTACNCVFKVITLAGSNQGNYFANATACSKRTLKTTVATQLKRLY